MFQILKYFFVINLYKKAKKQFAILVILLITILLSGLIISDVMTVVSGPKLYVLIGLKWMIVLLMILFIVLTLLKIIELASPATIIKHTKEFSADHEAVNRKKEITLNKERLLTESEMIIQKYTKGTK